MKEHIRKKFINDLKRHLIYIGKNEKKALQLLKDEIDYFIEEDTSYLDLVSHFGEPKELAHCYMDVYDEKNLKSKKRSRRLYFTFSTIILVVTITVLIFIIMNYIKGNTSYITREKEIITEN